MWGLAAEATLAYASLLSDDAWRDERFPWLLGSIAARYLVQSRIVEWWVHGEDIRATAGLGPQIQHWPIFLTVDMGVRMLPWTLGEAGHRPPGSERPDRPGGCRRGLVALGTRDR